MPTPPLPSEEERGRPFWQGAREGKLRIQACGNCNTRRYPDAPVCARCLASECYWIDVSSRGRVSAWCRFHRAYFEGFVLPHAVLLIELEGGVTIYGNLSASAREVVPYVGMEVQAEFEEIAPGVTMPTFRPADRAWDA